MSGAVADALQLAVFTALRADSTLSGLLADNLIDGAGGGAVYDRAPQSQESEDESAFPYVVIGDDTAIEHETDEIQGQESTLTLHIWSRHRGKKEVKQITDAIYNVLHDRALSVSGQTVLYVFWEFSESFQDPDGVTQHGVTRYRAVTMES